ncbi:helix-turn-helix transcriptional regulator [Escherichia coli]|nr:WYL domain-containing protein [Escherichia coli]
MPPTERRYDRLAVRLSLIISRLVAGETLDMQKLATEFDVSVRTLYRDFRERLIYLDLECHQGCYRLRTGAGPQGELDVLTFAHRTGIAGLFSGLDRRLVSLLLNCEGAPCLTGDAVSVGSPATQLSFYRLVQAITTCQRVTLLTDGNRCERLAPYRLIAQQSHWYLVAEHHDRPVVFSLSDIHLVQPLTESFKRNERFYRLTEDLSFIRALPHFQFIQQAITNITTT